MKKLSPASGYFHQGIPVPRVRVYTSYGSHRTVGYRFKRLTDLTELSRTGDTRVNPLGTQKTVHYRTRPQKHVLLDSEKIVVCPHFLPTPTLPCWLTCDPNIHFSRLRQTVHFFALMYPSTYPRTVPCVSSFHSVCTFFCLPPLRQCGRLPSQSHRTLMAHQPSLLPPPL